MAATQRDLFGAPVEPGHRDREAEVRQPQQAAVLAALIEAHPESISHAELCERVQTNRVSHRIAELQAEGWQIEGGGVLPLDVATNTQLYRLVSLDRAAEPDRKLLGLTVRWTLDDGLSVSIHKDAAGEVSPAALEELRGLLLFQLVQRFPDLNPRGRRLLLEDLR